MIAVTCPIDGAYLVHDEQQRPVEGVAVYHYDFGWVCEECSGNNSGQRFCAHINLVIKETQEG